MAGPTLERRHLEALIALARQPAFSKAAQQLLIAPSALAAAIREVERMVGEPIVRRTRVGMALTSRGLVMARAATGALRGMQTVLEDPIDASDLHGGVLVVHTSPTLAESLAANLVTGLRARHPGVRMVVRAPKRPVLIDIEYAVASGDADFGMTEPVGRPLRGLRYTALGSHQIGYAFPATTRRRPAQATLDDVRENGLLVVPEFESSGAYRELRSRAADVDDWVVARVTHRHAFVDLAAGGVGGFLCDYEARSEAQALGLHVAGFAQPVVRNFATITRVEDQRGIIRAVISESDKVRAAQRG